jgi:succinate dehydrogenase (ubiquinone) cytochrome b560 subunit
MAAAFGAWPLAAKVATKFAFALPFTFHSFNAFRHFAWDAGRTFKNAQVIRTGWAVVGISLASALGLAVFL